MKDPKAWADEDGQISPEIERLFRSAQPTRGMSEAERRRSEAAVASISQEVAIWPRAVVTVCFVAGVAAGVFVGIGQRDVLDYIGRDVATPYEQAAVSVPSAESPVTGMAAVATPRTEPPPTSNMVQRPSAPASASSMPVARRLRSFGGNDFAEEAPFQYWAPGVVTASQTGDGAFARERELLEKARLTLASNPSQSLAWLGEYSRRFPRGRLALAHDVLVIDALLWAGRNVEAGVRAEGLLAKVGRTPYEIRVKQQIVAAKGGRKQPSAWASSLY